MHRSVAAEGGCDRNASDFKLSPELSCAWNAAYSEWVPRRPGRRIPSAPSKLVWCACFHRDCIHRYPCNSLIHLRTGLYVYRLQAAHWQRTVATQIERPTEQAWAVIQAAPDAMQGASSYAIT